MLTLPPLWDSHTYCMSHSINLGIPFRLEMVFWSTSLWRNTSSSQTKCMEQTPKFERPLWQQSILKHTLQSFLERESLISKTGIYRISWQSRWQTHGLFCIRNSDEMSTSTWRTNQRLCCFPPRPSQWVHFSRNNTQCPWSETSKFICI